MNIELPPPYEWVRQPLGDLSGIDERHIDCERYVPPGEYPQRLNGLGCTIWSDKFS